jgi:hypothetical protein
MEDLEKQKANVELIGNLLLTSFKGSKVSDCKSPLDGRKFKIDRGGKCDVPLRIKRVLMRSRRIEIRKDFEHQSVHRTLSANPGKYFPTSQEWNAASPNSGRRVVNLLDGNATNHAC